MPEDVVTFFIDGSPERNGAIPVDAFLSKLRTFISALHAFERAFSGKQRRQIEFEIVGLTRNSPGRVQMRPRARASGFPVVAALDWSFDQLDRVYNDRPISPSVSQSALDAIIDLATRRPMKLPAVAFLQATYGNAIVQIDDTLAQRALALRATRAIDVRPPWRAGLSRGSLFGELRGVLDFEGERQFFIVPPSGADKVQCVFPETLRPLMVERLFRVVRAKGFLHYDGNSPFPYLLEADEIEGLPEPTGHFSDLCGVFSGMEPAAGGWDDLHE